MYYLTKSDFIAARECPAKLYYRKNGYPNTKQDDEFLQLLAEGGFMIGKMAQLLFPSGIEIARGDMLDGAELTKKYLQRDEIILFEPVVFVEGMSARMDIVIKHGKRIDLIEVKAKSFDPEECEEHITGGTSCFWKKREGGLNTDWQPYLEDVAYQAYVLGRAYPDIEVRPFLMLCDKSKRTHLDRLLQHFILRKRRDAKGLTHYSVEFTGDAEALRRDHLMIRVPVVPEVEHLLPQIEEACLLFTASLREGPRKIHAPLTTDCARCEYRLPPGREGSKNGFLECWGDLGKVSPHLLDLCFVGNLKQNGERLADMLFAAGRASFDDVPAEWMRSPKQGAWQRRQIAYSRKKYDWIGPDLKSELQKYPYPLHFIDFETSRMALPFHKDMRPYGLAAFQWSCHTIHRPGETPEHHDWINTTDEYPNIEFARTLKECLGRQGTVFMWAHHERSVLSEIARHMRESGLEEPDLIEWLEWMSKTLVDQCKIAREHYYHADMKGSVSIKRVLPAVWNNNQYLHAIPYLKPYHRLRGSEILSPYDALEKIEIGEQAEVVMEGSMAMRAYQEMMYGLHRGDAQAHEKWTRLLRQYCALDTMAMVIIYMHWRRKAGLDF